MGYLEHILEKLPVHIGLLYFLAISFLLWIGKHTHDTNKINSSVQSWETFIKMMTEKGIPQEAIRHLSSDLAKIVLQQGLNVHGIQATQAEYGEVVKRLDRIDGRVDDILKILSSK